MDPIEKLALNSKKKMMNKENIIMKTTNSNANASANANSNANSSQENFFRKTNKQFTTSSSGFGMGMGMGIGSIGGNTNSNGISKSEAYGTIIQIMKSDISQVQDKINEYSYITKMFKLSSKSSFITKRINEIIDSSDIKNFIERIVEESSSADKLSRVYNCQNANDLILKMGLELNMYDNFVKKLTDLFFILNLKLNGDENSSALSQENFSKFFVIKIVLEKLIEKSTGTYVNDTDSSINLNNNSMNSSQNNFNNTCTRSLRSGFGTFGEENLNIKTNNNNNDNINNENNNNLDSKNFISDSDKKKLEEFERIKNCSNINDLLNIVGDENNDNVKDKNNYNYNNNDNEFSTIRHISLIVKDFLMKVSIGYNELIKKYYNKKDLINTDISIKFNKPNLSMEGFLSQRLSIEKILSEKEKEREKEKQKSTISNNVYLTSDSGNNNENNKDLLASLKIEKDKLITELENLKNLNSKNLLEIEILNNKFIQDNKKYENELNNLKSNSEEKKGKAENSNSFKVNEGKIFKE